MLSTVKFEHGMEAMVGFSLGALLSDQTDPEQFFAAMASTAEKRAIRKLAAVARATDLQLLQSETASSVMDAVRLQVAMDPIEQTLREAVDFFGRLSTSFPNTQTSSEGSATGETATPPQEVGSPSVEP